MLHCLRELVQQIDDDGIPQGGFIAVAFVIKRVIIVSMAGQNRIFAESLDVIELVCGKVAGRGYPQKIRNILPGGGITINQPVMVADSDKRAPD